MADYRHHVSGFFAHREEVNDVYDKLISAGIPSSRIHSFDKHSVLPAHKAADSSSKVLENVLVDGAIGTVVGTGVGALIEVGLIAANVTLFAASPLLAPLVLMGWGAGIGGIIGASAGAAEHAKPLSNLVHDAVVSGLLVVVVETRSEEETRIAADIIKEKVGDYNDVAVKS
jgi:hypothetical protein